MFAHTLEPLDEAELAEYALPSVKILAQAGVGAGSIKEWRAMLSSLVKRRGRGRDDTVPAVAISGTRLDVNGAAAPAAVPGGDANQKAIGETEVTPHLVTTDKAAACPPALHALPPDVDTVRGQSMEQRIERDHQHLKGRRRPMRGFNVLCCVQVVCQGQGFYDLDVVLGAPPLLISPGSCGRGTS